MTVVLSCIFFTFIGIRIGLRIRTNKMEAKKAEIISLMKEVRNKNNEMLSNFSKVAHVASHTEGQWTEVDDFIMPMWME